jgi:hypothetical protein
VRVIAISVPMAALTLNVRFRPIADIRRPAVGGETMIVVERSPLIVAAAFSLAASVVLGAITFVWPDTPIAPFIVVNWLLFMLVGSLAFRPWRWRSLVKQPERHNLNVFLLVLLAFALASWFALFNAETIV